MTLTKSQLVEQLRDAAASEFGDWCGRDDARRLMQLAADMLCPEHDPNTVEVRILVRVDVDDSKPVYSAAGWDGGGYNDVAETVDEFASNADHFTDSPRYSWVTARVPKPEPVAEVEGTVEP